MLATLSQAEKAPRRKLVRGGNAKETPVLPAFKDAMEAIDDLIAYLDRCESAAPMLAQVTPQVRPRCRAGFRENNSKDKYAR